MKRPVTVTCEPVGENYILIQPFLSYINCKTCHIPVLLQIPPSRVRSQEYLNSQLSRNKEAHKNIQNFCLITRHLLQQHYTAKLKRHTCK